MNLRTYQGGDEGAIIQLWNRTLIHDPIDASTFYRKVLLDANFDVSGVWVAEIDSQLVGYIQAIVRRVPLGTEYEPDVGWITAIAVDPNFQGRGIASQLMDHALAYLRSKGRKRVEFSSYAPYYVVPGLDRAGYRHALAFFSSKGFTVQYSPVAMDKGLVDFVMPPDVQHKLDQLVHEGVVVEPISPPFFTRVLDFCDREFYADWSRALRQALAANIDWAQLQICREGETVLGFAIFGAYDAHLERFGPFGVGASQRGRGLGKALLYRTLAEMKRRGCHSAWFLWTGEKSPAGHLYDGAGFAVTRRFDILQKTL